MIMNLGLETLMKRAIINTIVHRKIHTSSSVCNLIKTMNKVLKGASPRKKKWSNSDHIALAIKPESLSQGATEGSKSSNSRRVAVLNKLFMKNVTDLMATGNFSSEFLGRGIEINRVQVTPDYKGVNVFWLAKGTQADEDIETVLKNNAGNLRHELAQLNVMGVVPKIRFVKDKQYAKIMEVDLRLARADFGDDYVPVDLNYLLKPLPVLNTAIPSNIKDEINKLENELIDEETEEEILPAMPINVLGLNHNKIMEKIKRGISKSQAHHRINLEQNETGTKYPQTTNTDLVQYRNQKVQNAVFKEFLSKRKIIKAKAIKGDKNYKPEADYLESERIEYYNNMFDHYANYKEFEDYLEDDT